jgi:endoglucanase
VLDAYLDAADTQGKPGVIVVYAIPSLDCSTFAEGGLAFDDYLEWVGALASGIEGREPWVILEPDALGQLGDCGGQDGRTDLLARAAAILDDAGARVYLDAGNAQWLSIDEAVRRITLVGFDNLAGFALNVSNYVATDVTQAYADAIATLTGLHYVIDTSRNGNGWNGEWCNAPDRALGETPRMVHEGYLDAFLWVKRPGESDGPCQGGPAAGQWWQEYALELASNAAANDG